MDSGPSGEHLVIRVFWDSVYVEQRKGPCVHGACREGMRALHATPSERRPQEERPALPSCLVHSCIAYVHADTHTRTVACVGLVPFSSFVCVLRVFQFLQVGVGNEKRASVENYEPGKMDRRHFAQFLRFWSLGLLSIGIMSRLNGGLTTAVEMACPGLMRT